VKSLRESDVAGLFAEDDSVLECVE
jgi:hypothetical protein